MNELEQNKKKKTQKTVNTYIITCTILDDEKELVSATRS